MTKEIKGGDRLAVIPKPDIDEVANEDNSTSKFVSSALICAANTYAVSLP